MDLSKLEKILENEPGFRYKQVKNILFKNLISSWQEATNLPKKLREKLSQEVSLDIKADLLESSDDHTGKALIYLKDGNNIETVLMRHKDRNTVCVSSQIGCNMGCDFCLTGQMGLKRNLNAEEIVEQVLFWSRYLKEKKAQVTNVVFMGMGEPMANYDEVIQAIKLLNDKEGLNIGARKISISTVGIVEGIKSLIKQNLQVNLALSLNAPDNQLRSRLMPVANRYTLDTILNILNLYVKEKSRKVMLEYVMLDSINDSPEQAKELADLLKQKLENLYVVNLISYNSTHKYKASPPKKIRQFKKVLEKNRVPVVERYRFGRDIKAACGQLSSKKWIKNVDKN